MLDKLMSSIGGDVVSGLVEKAGITTEQAQNVLPIAQESLQSGLMEQVTGGNVSGLLGMFNSSGGDLANNSIFSGIKQTFMAGIMSKMGLPESVAGLVAGNGMESIVGKIGGQIAGEGGQVDENSLMSGLGLGGGGGLMDAAKGMAQGKLGDIAGGLFK